MRGSWGFGAAILQFDRLPRIFSQSMRWLMVIAAAASMGLCIGNASRFRAQNFQAPEQLERVYGYWDGVLRKDPEPGRGIFLKFVNFPEGIPGQAFAQSVYFRAVYTLYPLPVLATGANVVVNEGKDLLKDNFYPNDQWLRDHGVGTVVDVGFVPGTVRPQLAVVAVRKLGS
jgi:hypothetical protein